LSDASVATENYENTFYSGRLNVEKFIFGRGVVVFK
jgi:hypothetical protein